MRGERTQGLDLGVCSPGKFFIFGSCELAGNASKTARRYYI